MSSQIETYEVGADLSAARGYALKISSGKVVKAAGATDKAFGILDANARDSSTSGNYVPVVVAGRARAIAGGAFVIGDVLTVDSNGKVIVSSATTDRIIGVALEAADAENDEVLINVAVGAARGS